jgi:hypothetical protein
MAPLTVDTPCNGSSTLWPFRFHKIKPHIQSVLLRARALATCRTMFRSRGKGDSKPGCGYVVNVRIYGRTEGRRWLAGRRGGCQDGDMICLFDAGKERLWMKQTSNKERVQRVAIVTKEARRLEIGEKKGDP